MSGHFIANPAEHHIANPADNYYNYPTTINTTEAMPNGLCVMSNLNNKAYDMETSRPLSVYRDIYFSVNRNLRKN